MENLNLLVEKMNKRNSEHILYNNIKDENENVTNINNTTINNNTSLITNTNQN